MSLAYQIMHVIKVVCSRGQRGTRAWCSRRIASIITFDSVISLSSQHNAHIVNYMGN